MRLAHRHLERRHQSAGTRLRHAPQIPEKISGPRAETGIRCLGDRLAHDLQRKTGERTQYRTQGPGLAVRPERDTAPDRLLPSAGTGRFPDRHEHAGSHDHGSVRQNKKTDAQRWSPLPPPDGSPRLHLRRKTCGFQQCKVQCEVLPGRALRCAIQNKQRGNHPAL